MRKTKLYTPEIGKYIVLCLLLTLLSPTSVAFAKLRAQQQQSTWQQNMKAGVELGFGIPYAWILGSMLSDTPINGVKLGGISANPNVRLGLICGYNLPIGGRSTIGPEVGLGYNMTRKIKLPKWGVSIQEHYLKIPIGLKLTFPKKDDVVISGMVIGYEFDVLLSSKLEYSKSDSEVLPPSSFRKDRDLVEDILDLPGVTGSIFIDSTLDIPNGLYLVFRTRFPLQDLMGMMEHEKAIKGLDKGFMHVARMNNTSWIEITLGFDIMKVYYPAPEPK